MEPYIYIHRWAEHIYEHTILILDYNTKFDIARKKRTSEPPVGYKPVISNADDNRRTPIRDQ